MSSLPRREDMYALPRPVVRDPPKIITLLDAAVSFAYRFSSQRHFVDLGDGWKKVSGNDFKNGWKREIHRVHGNTTSCLWLDLSSYSLSSTTEIQRVVSWEPQSHTASPLEDRIGGKAPPSNDFPADFTGAQNSHRRATQTSHLSYTLIMQVLKVQHNTLWSGISTWEGQTLPKTWSWPEGPLRYHSIQGAYLSFQLRDRDKNSTWNQDNILILLLMLC